MKNSEQMFCFSSQNKGFLLVETFFPDICMMQLQDVGASLYNRILIDFKFRNLSKIELQV